MRAELICMKNAAIAALEDEVRHAATLPPDASILTLTQVADRLTSLRTNAKTLIWALRNIKE